MRVYRFSTYHKDFKSVLPILIGYSVLVGAILFFFRFEEFFFWHIGLSILFLFLNYRKQPKTLTDADKTRILVELSLEKTLHHHLLSSIIYIVCVSSTFLFLFNWLIISTRYSKLIGLEGPSSISIKTDRNMSLA